MKKFEFTRPFILACMILLPSLNACVNNQNEQPHIMIGQESRVKENPRSYYNRFVNWRPYDGEIVDLNPPRMSWPYWPDFPNNWKAEIHNFRLQISSDPDMSDPLADINCNFNFYNTLPALKQDQIWYWRVGYDVGSEEEIWSPVRSFSIGGNAVIWDRSALAKPEFAKQGHPRVLFSSNNIEQIRQLAQNDATAGKILDYLRAEADKILEKDWWKHFPESDTGRFPAQRFYTIAEDLVTVCFVWYMTEEEKYHGVRDHAVQLASYPPGGRSSPEGLNSPMEGTVEDATQTNEFLALLFDWLYSDLNEQERRIMIHSLEWRIDHWMNTFAWKHEGRVPPVSLSGLVKSHQYEGSMDNAVCGLVLYEHSEIGRQWFELILNYMIGITSGHGFDGAWNEGAGYGASKLKWLTNASIYFDTALPQVQLGVNPVYRRIGEFFRRVVPVGMPHHAWGNQRNSMGRNHLANFRKLAYFTGDGAILYNWQQYGGRDFSIFRPWIEYVLPAYYQEPLSRPETDFVGFFPIDGWGMAASGPPSASETYEEGVGLTFQCRPRGGFSHSFYSDNSFILHAYGQMLNHGGSSSGNSDEFADATMSHNTVLIDGLGQVQPERSLGQNVPMYGKMVGYARGRDFVYFAGDATFCYPHNPLGKNSDRLSTGGRIPEIYTIKGIPYLKHYIRHVFFLEDKYFVIFDDLACSQPATFTWLYHILPDQSLHFDSDNFVIQYTVGDVKVKLQQISEIEGLHFENRRGIDGHINPISGEDYREYYRDGLLCAHNLWISNRKPAEQWNFLTVIYPEPPGGEIPVIKRLNDYTVRIGEKIICFEPSGIFAAQADILVDIRALRPESQIP